MSSDIRYIDLGSPRRVWAISSIHGEFEKLYALHDALLPKLRGGDRIVYLGNYTGFGPASRETVDELLTFRRLALCVEGMRSSDIVYLRGYQEQNWHRLMRLPFEQKPDETLRDLLANGLSQTLTSYGINECDGMRASLEGVLALTRWTGKIRDTLRANPGHDVFSIQHRRAAFTRHGDRYPLLFVPAGIDPDRPLEQQEDTLWADGKKFETLDTMYAPFEKVIRGYDPAGAGVRINCVTATLDGGAGFGGQIVCADMGANGKIADLLAA